MQKLQEQILALTSKMEQSNEIIINVQFEITQMKTANVENYKKALGNVKPGRVVNATVTVNLVEIIRGLPEVGSSPGDRMHRDLENVNNLLKFLIFPARKLSIATRLGRYDSDKGATCELLIHTENHISRDLILKSAQKIKTFNVFPDPIYISPELSIEDARKHNKCLK